MKTRFYNTDSHALGFRALVRLLEDTSFDAALRLLCSAAEASGRGDLYKQWALAPGDRLVTTAPRNPLSWLRHGRGPRLPAWEAIPPGADHLRYVTRADGRREILSQPYGLTWTTLQALVSWCQGHDLEAEVTTYAGHFPGRTLAVRIRRGDA